MPNTKVHKRDVEKLDRERRERHKRPPWAAEPPDIWVDFDPAAFVMTGLDVDDDLAFLMLVALQRRGYLKLAGVSVTAGNAALYDVRKNADLLFRLANFTQDELPGASWNDMRIPWKWIRWLQTIRGRDEGPYGDAPSMMQQAVRDRPPKSLTILALGPLTNVARALEDPDVARRVKKVVTMGGTLSGGPLDLNWASDRESARKVLDAPVNVTIVPIETCVQAAIISHDVESFTESWCNYRDVPSAGCGLVCAMRMQLYKSRWFVNPSLVERFPKQAHPTLAKQRAFVPWDVVASVAAFNDHAFRFEDVNLYVPPCLNEPCDYATAHVLPPGDDVDGLPGAGRVRAATALESPSEIVDGLFLFMGELPAFGRPPGVVLGALPQLFVVLMSMSLSLTFPLMLLSLCCPPPPP